MFGGSSNATGSKTEPDSKPDSTNSKPPSPEASPSSGPTPIKTTDQAASGEKRSGNGSPPGRSDNGSSNDKKRRSSGVSSRASSLFASAKNTLNFSQVGRSSSDLSAQTPIQKLGKQDPALAVPQGSHNNSAGESMPGPKSTFRVGVWEDRNKKCRRTMEDTHSFLYNFLPTPAPIADAPDKDAADKADKNDKSDDAEPAGQAAAESDNGYFAIFDGHAGTFAADWCGKKLHVILEDIVRKHPNTPMPELLDQTFTTVDAQLEKLPVKNSGCTAAIAVLRWEDRVPSDRSATGSQPIAPAASAAAAAAAQTSKAEDEKQSHKPPEKDNDKDNNNRDKEGHKDKETCSATTEATTAAAPLEVVHARLKPTATRQRVLYTANVGDARIILCRSGKALRLSYDHKGSDENEGRRIANAGGLILNNRVNGVLAVTRALGDAYMKDLVTGHPYTTETVIQPDSDEFVIIACDGIWDVCSDQEAVDLVRGIQDPIVASKTLVDHALSRFSTDNLSCMVVRFEKEATIQSQNNRDVGVETDNNNNSSSSNGSTKVSEVDKLLNETKQKIADGSAPAVGISPSNSGRGHDPIPVNSNSNSSSSSNEEGEFVPTSLDGAVLEEEPSAISDGEADDDGGAKESQERPAIQGAIAEDGARDVAADNTMTTTGEGGKKTAES
ncbi:Protein phosphatase 2C-like protein [Hapsidospora chrysogenum ATCC 11550]|uniref:Protein phosphatase 2C-like protein n=1 Tax=Hapsidospora chrysogenum (strain ATCC 11550 / CBS 779.69 / DSM 880 / IAM 14645 / JCM 23072 / IMI 49137) TaxID=857340 RepID=A0A086T3J0_HAPC1|nr:Protein phosphatase 2C-like protein [Hapsidospora chrysogenum ATCC 11550]